MKRTLEKRIFISFLLLSLLVHVVVYFGAPRLDLLHLSIPSLYVMDLESAVPETSPTTHTLSQPLRTVPVDKPQQAAKLTDTPESGTTSSPPERTAETSPQKPSPQGDNTPASESEDKPSAALSPQLPKLLANHREKLHFNIYWLGVHVGTAILEALREDSNLTITSKVNSNSVISAFYRVEDSAECRIVDGKASNFKLKIQEGKHRRDRETIFDYDQDRITFLNHMQKEEKHFPMNNKKFWDVISGFYYVRTMPLSVGQKVYIDIFDSGRFATTAVEIIRTERMKLANGKDVETLVIKPVIVTEGLFKKTGDIFIWLTNDAAKTPVRVETSIKIGTVTAELQDVEVEM